MPEPGGDFSREEVQDLLPWFAAGSLDAADSRRVADWLAQHPDDADVQAELEWLRLTASQVKAEVQTQLPPANQGFDRLLEKLRADEAAQAATAAPAPSAESPRPDARRAAARTSPGSSLHKLWRWLRQASPARSLGLAGLALAQAAVIVVLVQTPSDVGGPGQVPLSNDPRLPGLPALADAALLQVTFAPTATELQIRTALQQAQATLVAGPGAIGIYTVAVPRAAAARSVAALRQQAGVVESVQEIAPQATPERPAR